MGLCGKAPVTKIVLLVAATLLIWRIYVGNDASEEEKELLRQLEDEKKMCLWRKGLESSSVLGDEQSFSTFNCPLGEEAYPPNLCTAHVIYLNHTEKRFVARTPSDLTSR